MKQRGINQYLVIIILLLLGLILLNSFQNREDDYTRAEFVQDMEAGRVKEVLIHPNGEAPTGYLEVLLATGEEKTLYATDVTEMEALTRSGGIEPQVLDIQRENWFLTYMLPVLVVIIAVVFIFVIMNAQGGSGGSNSKMMNFGKSRARHSMGEGRITLKDVAGLKEEKEELEEIIDFLKEPGKFTKVGARPEQERRCWPRPWREKPMYPASAFPGRILWKCLWAWAHPVSGTCSWMPKSIRPVLFLLMRSTRWQGAEAPVWAADMTRESRR